MKLVKPYNLDLNKSIIDERLYSYLTNNQNKLGICFKRGKVIRKLIPASYYFINQIICAEPAYGNARTKGFKRVRIADVDNVMSYAKMSQVIHFLVQQKIIEVRGISEFITVQGRQFVINAKYFRLIAPYNGKIELFECEIKTKKKTTINQKAKLMVAKNDIIRHQYDLCKNYVFNFNEAETFVNDLYSRGSLDNRKLVDLNKYLSKLKNRDIIFTYSEKTNRIATIVNCCPKLLRPYFTTPTSSSFTELDFTTFNVQVLVKLIDDNITISNISENLIKELDLISAKSEQDFYQHVVQIFEEFETKICRNTAKEIVLWHWINARIDSKRIEYQIMSTLYPEITKMMVKLKGDTYESYRNYCCNFMIIESQLTQEIYAEFHKQYPNVYLYNIYDSFMVEKPYALNLKRIMKDISSRYFQREIRIKEK